MDKFIFIVNSFPPINNQNSIRALELSKRLIKEGLTPIILTRRVVIKEPKDYDLIKEIPQNLEVIKTRVIELKRKYSLRTLFFKIIMYVFYLFFYIHWIPFGYLEGKKILRKSKNIRFLYSTGPPHYSHIITYLLYRKFKIPYIIEYRDPWNYNPYGLKKRKNIDKIISLIIEHKIIKSADIIIAISESLKRLLVKSFPSINKNKIYVIENGLNLKEIKKSNFNDKKEITFTFIGKLYGQRDIDPLLRIIAILKKKGEFVNLKFLLKIFGEYNHDYLRKRITNLNIQDLVYLGPFLPRNQLLEEINKCYLAVHIGENINYPTIGFKVWDYLSCRKKILYLGREDSYTSKFLIENEFGIVIPIDDISRGKKVFKKLLFDIKNREFPNIIAKEKLEIFSWDNKVKKLIKCIKDKF